MMVDINRILCPVDFSEFSERAFEHAVAIARWFESAITVLHIVDVRLETPVGPPLAPIALAPPVLTSAAREPIAGELQRLVAAAAAPDVAIETIVRDGRPDTAILELAAMLPADLLVMGTHGRSGFDRLVMGSVTEKVLRKAACPVLSVPPRSHGSGAPVALKSILCPVDFSQSSMEALQCAVSLAEESDGRLTVLHVADALSPHDLPVYELQNVAEFQAECDRRLRQRLADFVPGAARAYCTIEERVTSGKPWREILRVAQEQQADLIVIGIRGRNSVDRALFGSTTEQVVRQAVCPVLTLRT
jgi:nucleotide-binding universal stress UspA family protein